MKVEVRLKADIRDKTRATTWHKKTATESIYDVVFAATSSSVTEAQHSAEIWVITLTAISTLLQLQHPIIQ